MQRKTPMNKNKFSLPLLLLFLITGAVARCWNINQSFWWDEIWSTMAYANASSVWRVVSDLGYYFNNHVLYSLLCRLSIGVLGESEITARLPSLLLGLLGIVALYSFGKKITGTAPALLAAFFLSISAFHVDHSTEARGYSGFALCSILSSFYYLTALASNKSKDWFWFAGFTVLGFYFHPCMIAVSAAQFFSALLFFGGLQIRGGSTIFPRSAALRSFLFFLLASAVVTLILYAPLLHDFFVNLRKVRIVHVDRGPFLISLLHSILPGIISAKGAVLYGVFFISGLTLIFKKSIQAFIYFVVLLFVPVALYLLANPMFVFERYFIYTLPVALLIVAGGICRIAGSAPVKDHYKAVLIIAFAACITYVQAPAIKKIVTQDRQNYREAIEYVEQAAGRQAGCAVFSIGYAGEHFKYYAHMPVVIPRSYDEFVRMLEGKQHVWCLITAWLPSLRPPSEDIKLYEEEPEHEKIYQYIMKYFTLKKSYSSRYPVQVYYLER